MLPEFIENLEEFTASDRERCGILIVKNRKAKVIECENKAQDPTSDYAISMDDYNHVLGLIEGTGYEILGFFHTHLPHHPSDPSDEDLEGAQIFPDYLNCVYKPDTREMTWYGGSF